MEIELLKELYEKALTIRRFEQFATEQYRSGNIYGYLHPYLGEEAIAVGSDQRDRIQMTILSAHTAVMDMRLPKAMMSSLMMAELFGKSTGYCKGRGGSMHVANLKQYNLGANGIVGGGIPIAHRRRNGCQTKRDRPGGAGFLQ